MAEEIFEPETLTLTDEDGNEAAYELIACQEVDGRIYYALIPQENNENNEYVILRSEPDPEDPEEELLVTIDDDDEFDKVADVFDDMLFEDSGD